MAATQMKYINAVTVVRNDKSAIILRESTYIRCTHTHTQSVIYSYSKHNQKRNEKYRL